MSKLLQPIPIVDQVIEEYRSYLLTEFRAKDPQLREALREALERPLFLSQENFFQAHRPFKDGAAWRALGLDAKLAAQMEQRSGSDSAFLHQEQAVRHLLSPSATPLVVTTGTGSGKTECFLLPVLQNAIEDAAAFSQSGLTAILVYPMNALANDQEERIGKLLEGSGHTNIRVAKYDRSADEAKRIQWRKNPPHILLTNYMMLEYLLVRPADREALFANHRCRFVVLDEVHTYRGSLGSNIALLIRRLQAHLAGARQDWNAEDRGNAKRFPRLIPVGTSATIKSVEEAGRPPEEVRRLRDEAVQVFFSGLTGVAADTIRVLGEELRELIVPADARWPETPALVPEFDYLDDQAVARAAAVLAGLPAGTRVDESARCAAILWFLNRLLARKPMSVTEIVEEIIRQIPARKDAGRDLIRQEVDSALRVGSAIPEGVPGGLRLKVHRFARGGWVFHRCVDPACGMLYARGEEKCECGMATAPLHMCRNCGADVLRFTGTARPEDRPLSPKSDPDALEWMLYSSDKVEEDEREAEEEGGRKQMKGREILSGSFDPSTCSFAADSETYPVKVVLAPARNRCLVCGARGGSHNVVTPVSLGTSAAVRVLSESLIEGLEQQNRSRAGYDGKDRLLIFADSRQDAAHQARFITYAGRYDRMRRRLVQALEDKSVLRLDEAIKELAVRGIEAGDNEKTRGYKDFEYLNSAVKAKALAWEEAPLLDDLAVTTGYRASVFNLGLVGVIYDPLEKYVLEQGADLARRLGISTQDLVYIYQWLLDEMRMRSALSRPMICIHPANPNCPDEFRAADWERQLPQPSGFACSDNERPLGWRDPAEIEYGIKPRNFWRKTGGAGRAPRIQQRLTKILKRLGGIEPDDNMLEEMISFLMPGQGPGIIIPHRLDGIRKPSTLLQVNAESVKLALVEPGSRFRCSVCNMNMPWVREGFPCPACNGKMAHWLESDIENNRYVQRIKKREHRSLYAGEHTAQITGQDRIQLETDFKASAKDSPVNVLSCSPTLEMGIDVGQLDAVMMRNIPPRPDNYAQRGGRAGRRNRVGVVMGYTRRTPHDSYFYEKPREMIAGEVPAPLFSLSNKDVVIRHLSAVALGAADPGLAGRMAQYVTLQGEVIPAEIDMLVSSFEGCFNHAADLVMKAWGAAILEPLGLASKAALVEALKGQSARIRDLFDRVAYQIKQLQAQIDVWTQMDQGRGHAAMNARELQRRILGIPSDARGGERSEADDRSAGNPMRRFAEFGILPGYEFPSEPATLHLLGDPHEEETIAVTRRFGLAQYQPDAPVHARGHRWRVAGLDKTSPWNPKTDEPTWVYTVCEACGLRYATQEHARCPRCGRPHDGGKPNPGYEFGGFLAVRDDRPVLEEEDRLPAASLVQCHPQWNGRVTGRYELSTGWRVELRAEEEVRWVNESRPPSTTDIKKGIPVLHDQGRGFFLCPTCGRILTPPDEEKASGKTRKVARKKARADEIGHAPGCPKIGQMPVPIAMVTKLASNTLRILVNLPPGLGIADYKKWGYSLGYALRVGIRQLYMLDGAEVEFELEGPWANEDPNGKWSVGCMTFIDASVGGSGFLERAAAELHLVARRALDHLDHQDCESSCYRCLKSYQNQRHHEFLSWPGVLSHLEAMASDVPAATPLERGDTQDPRPWLEAYRAGVGSPLELKFLHLFEKHGLAVEKQIEVSPMPGEPPISCADFVVKGKRIAIFIDGAAFHAGARLRRDKLIRARLRSSSQPWVVLEWQASDLSKGKALFDTIKGTTA